MHVININKDYPTLLRFSLKSFVIEKRAMLSLVFLFSRLCFGARTWDRTMDLVIISDALYH